MEFDLRDGSKHVARLEDYLEEVARRGDSLSDRERLELWRDYRSQGTTDAPILTPEDEEILDRVWARHPA